MTTMAAPQPAAPCRREDPLHFHDHVAVTRWITLAGGREAVGFKCVGCGKTSRTWTVMAPLRGKR